MLPLALQPEVLARNDFFLSLSTYTFPPRHTPPLRASIDADQVDRSLTRSQSTISLTRPHLDSTFHHTDINAADSHLNMPSYTLPRSSSLPALRLRSASSVAPPPPMPPYLAEVYAYGTYVSSMRKVRDDAKEVLQDVTDDEGDVHEGDGTPGEVLDLMSMLQEKGSARSRGPQLRLTGNHALYRHDMPTRSHSVTKKRYPIHATRPAPPPHVPHKIVSNPTTQIKIDISIPPDVAAHERGLASSTPSSSGSDTELCSPLTSTLYAGPDVDMSPLDSHDSRIGLAKDENADDIDIFSALKWRHSSIKIDGLPVLPPIPKMTNLMDGLFTISSTPGRDNSPERAKEDETEYDDLLPSYTTSTSFPHLAHLASPFLHPRPAPSPPSLSLPTAVARTPTISKVHTIPSCFPSIESSGRGGLSALGLVLEGDEQVAKNGQNDNADEGGSGEVPLDDDPFRRSFNLLQGDKQTLAPSHFEITELPATQSKTPKKLRHYRHSFRPLSAFNSPTEQYVPYTPPGQVRSMPQNSASEEVVAPLKSTVHLGMSRSMSNLHLPFNMTSIGSWPNPQGELHSRFDPDNGSDEASACGTARRRSPKYRIGRTLTRTRSGFGALLRGRGVPQTPKNIPADLHPETRRMYSTPEKSGASEKQSSSGKLTSRLGLNKLEGRWIRMGLGRRRSSD